MKSSILRNSLFALIFLVPAPAMAAAEVYTSFFSSVAVGGYDPVAYFTENKAVEGKTTFSHQYKGAEWRFSSRENLDKFVAMPQKYAPQYGGYCAWAVSQNYTAKGDPQHWSIEGGKLYLNYDSEIKSRWLKDPADFIEKADANWPDVLN